LVSSLGIDAPFGWPLPINKAAARYTECLVKRYGPSKTAFLPPLVRRFVLVLVLESGHAQWWSIGMEWAKQL